MKARAGGWAARTGHWLSWYAPLLAVALLPAASSWLYNRYQVSVQDLIMPVIVSALTAAVVAGVYHALSVRDRLAATVAAVPATLVFASNYDNRVSQVTPVFEPLNPFGLGGLEGLVFGIVLAIIVLWLWRRVGLAVAGFVRRRGWKERDIATAIVIAVVVTFTFQFFSVANDLITEWPQFFYHPPKLAAAPASAKTAPKPDMYYIVLEDYANNDVLKKQFGFDNAGFTNYLKTDQYTVNPSAYVNYPYTTMSLASTLSAGYLNNLISLFSHSSRQTVVPFNDTTRNAPVAQALQSIGYKYDLVGNWYEAFNISHVADNATEVNGLFTVMGHTFTLDNFPKIWLTNSLFGRLVESGIRIGSFTVLGYANEGDVDLAHSQLAKLKELAAQPAGGRFIFADILVPHEPPFYFNADGSISPTPDGDNIGEPLRRKYIGEVRYINGQMQTILSEIDKNSGGKAAVVLLGDEGPQLLKEDEQSTDFQTNSDELERGNMADWTQGNLQLKYGTLAAVKLPGVDSSAITPETMSSVNIFRLVLDEYFGYQLPYLPQCYYAYPDGRDNPLTFTNINAELAGQSADARCQSDGSLSGQ